MVSSCLYTVEPYAVGGRLGLSPIEKIQIEMDSGKVAEVDGRTLIDMNRAGVGLLEVVTAPVFRSASESIMFLKTLRATLKEASVCGGGLESGQFRIDVNVSVTGPDAPKDAPPLGVRVEIKNLNSFAAVTNAIEHESRRHLDLLLAGKLPQRETRGFNPVTKETVPLRSKEDHCDYRFIRDFDIPRIEVSQELLERIRKEIPRTREQRVAELSQQYGLSMEQSEKLLTNQKLLDLFQSIIQIGPNLDVQFVFNWLMVDLIGQVHRLNLDSEKPCLGAETAVDLLRLILDGRVSRNPAKEVLSECLLNKDCIPLQSAERLSLLISPVSDEDLSSVCKTIFDAEPSKAKEASQGTRSLDYFMGPLMKRFKGSVQPQRLRQILINVLDEWK